MLRKLLKIAAGLLIAALVTGGVLYQFFGSLWTMGAGGNRVGDQELPEDDDDEDEDAVLKAPKTKP